MNLIKIWRRFCLLAGLLPGLLAAALSAQAQGVAMALDRTGEVEVTAAAKVAKLKLLDYLAADAELRLPAAASAVLVYLATSQEWQFDGPGRYRLAAGQPVTLQGKAPKARGVPLAAVQAIAKLEPTQRERVTVGAVVMRSLEPPRIVGPNNVDVLDPRTSLVWQNMGDRPIRVSLLGAGGGAPLAQTVTRDTQWTLPLTLPAGDYTWELEVASDPPVWLMRGRFRVVDAADARRARLGPAPAGQAAFSQRLAYAMLLEGENLRHDALLAWRALAAERPDEESLKRWAR